MMVSSNRILELVGTARWTGMNTGRVRNMLHSQDTDRSANGQARRRFFEAAIQTPQSTSPTYTHPAETAIARQYRRTSDGEDLSPVELMWLQRLPLDPKGVTHDDAARLAGLHRSISKMKNPSSHQLIESIWLPVRDLHDLRLAEQRLELAKQAPPSVPESAHAAVSEALAEEHPDWPSGAATAHARELLNQRISTRDRQHQDAVSRAEATVERLRVEAVDRQVLVRENA